MRSFEGHGGEVRYLGGPHTFVRLPLLNLNDGWDWRSPDETSYWLEEPMSFASWDDGQWTEVDPQVIFHRAGTVSMRRCLPNVYASGICRTSSLACLAERWSVTVPIVVKDRSTLGDTTVQTKSKESGPTVAVLYGAECEAMNECLVSLPCTGGALIGVGRVTPILEGIEVKFNSEGVRYALC